MTKLIQQLLKVLSIKFRDNRLWTKKIEPIFTMPLTDEQLDNYFTRKNIF